MYTGKVVKRRPVPTFRNLDELFAKGIDQFFGSDFVSNPLPATNVLETDKAYKLEIVAVGFDKDNFTVNTDKGVLTISAETEKVEKDESVKYTRREFRKNSFKRSFQLPEIVDVEKISAIYENGILNVTLPKDETVIVKKTIKVL